MKKKFALELKDWKEFKSLSNFSEVIKALYSRGFEIVPTEILKELKDMIQTEKKIND